MSEQKNFSLDLNEVAVAEFAVEQYINKVQERIAEEHSGVARFMLESNLVTANALLAKLRPAPVVVEAPTFFGDEPIAYDDLAI
jgi:hypothetical protein